MGDRNNPIKFGPEWLRNLARERNAGPPGHNSQSVMAPTSPNTGPTGGNSASGTSSTNTSAPPTTKVQLAKLRYGREEMLALYDRTAEAPPELKFIDVLFLPRGKVPFALNNTFEDEIQRDNMRGGPPIGGLSTPERFGMGRGMGRGLNVSDGLGRGRASRMPFIRQQSVGRGVIWHNGLPRMPGGYSGGPDDDTNPNIRSSWSGGNGSPAAPNRNSGEQPEWSGSKLFRSKRQGQATNWRQSREEGEEWRSPDGGRPRPNQHDKWERDWNERPNQDKQGGWNNNRRTWVGGETHNSEDSLPEWAVENAEACGGTFDSSGAFHGYSSDDTNIPKPTDNPFPLTRSHTHGSFVRSKTVEEGSEEWWASEKAKKLSPKRFDASDVKFKKMSTAESSSDTGTDSKAPTSKDELQAISEKLESSAADPPENASGGYNEEDKFINKNTYKSKFGTESKTFDSHMRSDINLEEASESQDRGNFQSVMITPNNSLRQKHQNIVAAASEVNRDSVNRDKSSILQLLQNAPTSQALELEMRKQQQAADENNIVDDIFDMNLEDKDMMPQGKIITSPLNQPNSSNMTSPMINSLPQMQNASMQLRLSSPGYPNQGLTMNKSNMQNPGMQSVMSSGLQGLLPSGIQLPSTLQMGGLPPTLQQVAGMHAMGMQVNMQQTGGNPQQGGMQGSGLQSSGMQGSGIQSPLQGNMQSSNIQSGMQNPGMQNSGLQSSMQSVGMTNSALNASLGLPVGPISNSMPLQGLPSSVLPTSGMNSGMGGPNMQGLGPGSMQGNSAGISGYPAGGLLGMSNTNVGNNSLFIGQSSNSTSMGSPGDIPMPSSHGNQSNMYPMHALHAGTQTFGTSMYSNMMQQPPNQLPPNQQNLVDQWYYEDPEKNIQGPFTSKEMDKWYKAGFFSPTLMVRRACDALLRPLGSYGPVVPFAQMDMMSPFPLSGGFDRSPGPHESILNSQQALGLESVMNVGKLTEAPPPMNSMPFGLMGHIKNPHNPQQQPMVDSLWSQPPPTNDLMWMQQAMTGRNDSRVNNLPMFFWDQQPSTIASSALLPEDITKEMKTEDQILAQLRASQNINTSQGMPFTNEQQAATQPSKPEDPFPTTLSATPNLEELQKLIKKDTLAAKSSIEANDENIEIQSPPEKPTKNEKTADSKALQTKPVVEAKQTKQSKSENDKATKNKENTKSKNKKKEEKKEEPESKNREDENQKTEKRSEETSPTKSKKEDKLNKKDLEKEKKEWLKEGFTIVKGSEKNTSKDNKKKEESKVAEEAERRRKEEERLAAEEEKKRKQAEAAKTKELQQQQQQQRQAIESVAKKAPWSAVTNQAMLATSKDGLTLAEIQRLEREKKLEQMKEQQQMMQIIAQQQAVALAREQELQQQQQQQRQAIESVAKKAPWSAVTNQAMLATSKDGLTLAEIQRLEREKKLEQMKEQQQMMQIIAQQQAVALAREQEMQAGLGWAKKKGTNFNVPGQSLAEIQAEARKQAAAAAAAVAAAAAAQALEEAPAPPPPSHAPWASAPNGGGFWDTQPNQPGKADKAQESPKATAPEQKSKKKAPAATPSKKETTPAAEFEIWCTTVLASWSSKIDVPTFVGFLKDIESPYEVKDYVKCYLGESKDSNDFARNFLERRSKLLRVGMVTPSDDLCSPAMAVNPRTASGSDYQEVKGKGKKTKKNKMLKVDARILGFSVTAAEDRINVGDIDTV